MESNSMASTSGVKRAFNEISSYSCTPATPIHKPSFDVFINHRGPDVKKTIAKRIYDILECMEVKAFLDSEEMEFGDFLPKTLEAAIRSATLHIAIFSKGYAESAWCLEELSLMLKSGAKIVPIFYDVEPSDLRFVALGKGKYVAAFSDHEKKDRYKPEKLQEWKKALSDVSFYFGDIIRDKGDEMRLFKNIVNIVKIVQKEISNVPLIVAKHPVAMKETVEDFVNTLQLDSDDQGVQIVGIWGMGGSGKTTLAKELYNKRSLSAERSCFIFNIREAKDILWNKQSELLKCLGSKESVDNIEKGKANLVRHLRSFKVCIVLDDVDDVDQLDALMPIKDGLGKGSLIIVTTRDYEVLRSWGICSIYKMKALDSFYAEQLFCWHAFLHPSPDLDHGFKELVKEFVKACQRLPLSLKVFGGQLYGNSNKQHWEALLHKISRVLHENIRKILKISYDALDNEEKEAFLDIACFFLGEEKSLAIDFWDGLGWSGLHTWEKLLNNCLIEVDDENRIRMHDHLRDLGREVAEQHSTSRIWSSQQIIDLIEQTKKTITIRGIKLVLNESERHMLLAEHLSENSFLKPFLNGLKLLVIEGFYLNQPIHVASRELLWLRWSNFKQRRLPLQLSLKKLKVLQLSFGSSDHLLEELWEDENNAPVQLRELVISRCSNFRRFPSYIGCLTELRKIVIKKSEHICSLPEEFSEYIDSLPEEFCRLQLLEHLQLSEFKMLSSLPSRFGDLTNLQYLNLSRCSNLRRLPDSFKNLISLKYLDFGWCEELMLGSEDFENITKLEYLRLSYCRQLEELPENITNQASLRCLYLDGVNRLKEVPIKIDQLSRLREIEIGSKEFLSLPNSLGNLSSLKSLSISGCFNLESLPSSLGNLSSLKSLSISSCFNLESLPSSLGNLSSLTKLSIRNCGNLESLPSSLGNLSSLTELSIRNCFNLESLPSSLGNLCSLTDLSIRGCPKLKQLDICESPISQVDFGAAYLSFALSNLMRLTLHDTAVCRCSFSEDRYPRLQTLELFLNNDLREITALPVKLESLNIYRCPELEELPSFTRLTSLRYCGVEYCDRIGKIEGLQDCTRLETLILITGSERLEVSGIKRLENLRRLQLRANKGSMIQSCIQNIEKWADDITVICTRAVPEASSIVDSFEVGLTENISVADSFSNTSSKKLVVRNQSSTGNAIMLCFVMNGGYLDVSLYKRVETGSCVEVHGMWSEREGLRGEGEGRWGVIVVLPERSRWVTGNAEFYIEIRNGSPQIAERDLVERGSPQRLYSAFQKLLKKILSLLPSYGRRFSWLDSHCPPQRGVERGLAVRGGEDRLGKEALLPLLQSISS